MASVLQIRLTEEARHALGFIEAASILVGKDNSHIVDSVEVRAQVRQEKLHSTNPRCQVVLEGLQTYRKSN